MGIWYNGGDATIPCSTTAWLQTMCPMSESPLPFAQVARLPRPGDNVAVAVQTLSAGTRIQLHGRILTLDHTVLEGHRFAVAPIPAGAALLSWGLPFGRALRPIAPGEYVRNAAVLEALAVRDLDVDLPSDANFADYRLPYTLDPAAFRPGVQVPPHPDARTFLGYRRPGGRGVGTRNMVVLLGTSSRTGGFVRQLEARLRGLADAWPNIDGIVAVAHTEGGHHHPNNLELVLRTLAGFMVHPNVAAVLAVDYGVEPVNNRLLAAYMREQGYPLDHVQHGFFTIEDGFLRGLDRAEEVVRSWLEAANAVERTPEPLAHLSIALQCGGSDAFSGISGNPLAGWVAREVIRYGGRANLAETDELLGAEPYLLQRVRDLETAQAFLATLGRFQEWAAWHGQSAAGNPSGGNKLRGLYNIVLKSLGAAAKKDPKVRLDWVIPYGARMDRPGFYFMDSPGNDLESIAGQVAAGCNLIFFVTGNGSITNFPFVPTIKIVTTTRRYQLLQQDMDVNAGRYLDGTPMEILGRETLELTVRVASGEVTAGERAGHAQVQLWRDWHFNEPVPLEPLLRQPPPGGHPLPQALPPGDPPQDLPIRYPAFPTPYGVTAERVGLIFPTSLCAGQIAAMAATRLARMGLGTHRAISRFVALVHTEGCGVSSGPAEDLYLRTLLGYARHPRVAHLLFLEHGCEKTHNDYIRHVLGQAGLDPELYGWASIQLDGGIHRVLERIEGWFRDRIVQEQPPARIQAGPPDVRVGLLAAGPVSTEAAQALGRFAAGLLQSGGTLVLPEKDVLLACPAFVAWTLGPGDHGPSLAYGQSLQDAAVPRGLHLMASPTQDWLEVVTGLAATGVDLILAYVGLHPLEGHPLVPVLQVTDRVDVAQRYGMDMDGVLAGDPATWPQTLATLLAQTLAGAHCPRAMQMGNVDFQLTRGPLGVSL